MANRQSRPGYYVLYSAHVDGETYTDAYCIDDSTPIANRLRFKSWLFACAVLKQLGVDDEHYTIAWCPSRNQAQKSALKNWS